MAERGRTLHFKFLVTYADGLDRQTWVASGRDDLEAEEAVEIALEADGEEGTEIELLGEATDEDLTNDDFLFVTER